MGLKAWARRSINSVLEPMGFHFSRFLPEQSSRAMVTEDVRCRQIRLFKDALRSSLVGFDALNVEVLNENEIKKFILDLRECPIRQTGGGGGFNTAILLWSVIRILEPALIVESGIFRGFTTWVNKQAAQRAEIHAFDISFAELKIRIPDVQYHQCDWCSYELNARSDCNSLVYFDDHVNQWKRLTEAAKRGFRYVLFDDSFPAIALHRDGQSAAPTIDMLFDEELADGDSITWKTECGNFIYRYDAHTAELTRRLIKHSIRLPDLGFIFGYTPANLILIELEQPS